MSLDTKYRPTTYKEVLGQESTKTILKRFVERGKGFEQSYLFAGGYGSGKTTLGRILARALLCDAPQEGDPCDSCPSCLEILSQGMSATFVEVDAATNSGKAEIKRLLEDLNYDTFSGKKRLYLFDEAHQLSRDALDALLKPLEENLPDSQDKKLVCIFCTTEPEKMRATVLSRCAPAFVIEPLTPEIIADRLEYVCQQEGIDCEREALEVVAASAKSHIRDALKAVEGISMLGDVNIEHTTRYLRLDLIKAYQSILCSISQDLPKVFGLIDDLTNKVSPSILYQNLAEISLTAYEISIGAAKPPPFWDSDLTKELVDLKSVLLGYASRFAKSPARPTVPMLKCDIMALHHGVAKEGAVIIQHVTQQAPAQQIAHVNEKSAPPVSKVSSPKASLTDNGVYVLGKAVADRKTVSSPSASGSVTVFDANLFARLLVLRIDELDDGAVSGPARRTDMGSH